MCEDINGFGKIIIFLQIVFLSGALVVCIVCHNPYQFAVSKPSGARIPRAIDFPIAVTLTLVRIKTGLHMLQTKLFELQNFGEQ